MQSQRETQRWETELKLRWIQKENKKEIKAKRIKEAEIFFKNNFHFKVSQNYYLQE